MMKKWMPLLLVFIIGFSGGMLINKNAPKDDVMQEMGSADDGHMSHSMLYEVPAGAVVPTVDLQVHKDPKSGYNIEIITTNYTFAPEKASTDAVMGEGHAHVYVDGVKINRVYGHWYHLATLGDVGEHEVRVELSANDHSAYAKDGVVIDASKKVTVEAAAAMDMEEESHEHEGEM